MLQHCGRARILRTFLLTRITDSFIYCGCKRLVIIVVISIRAIGTENLDRVTVNYLEFLFHV